ncbi:MAG TPA: DUF4239 domain-containing protein [Patescibacteria group bacterium]|nr:DUF4239 domain-containing protein [Patescibacteria group bacterium]
MILTLGTYDYYLYAAVALIGTFAGAWFLLWVTQRSRHAPVIHSFRGVSPPFVGVIGVLFALTLAFLGNDTWNARDRALNAVFQEADSLRGIQALAEPLPSAARIGIDDAVRGYARVTIGEEWPLLAMRRSSSAASDQLDKLLALVASDAVASHLSPAVQSLMLQQVIQVRTTRSLRIALSQTHVNPLKWLGMAVLGFLTMITIAMIHVDQARAEILAVMLFAVAAAPTAAIVLVQGNPFQRPAAITSAPIATLLEGAAVR